MNSRRDCKEEKMENNDSEMACDRLLEILKKLENIITVYRRTGDKGRLVDMNLYVKAFIREVYTHWI